MGKPYDKIYVISEEANGSYFLKGMSLNEFFHALGESLNLLLLDSDDFYPDRWHHPSQLGYLLDDEVPEMLDVADLDVGNFHWVDFRQEDDLDSLTKRQIADLLYLAHVNRPVESPFVPSLMNRFAYLSHDDSAFVNLWCRHNQDFDRVFSRLISLKAETLHGRSVSPLGGNAFQDVRELIQQGFSLDLRFVENNEATYKVPFSLLGKFDDYSVILEAIEKRSRMGNFDGLLVFEDGVWTVVS